MTAGSMIALASLLLAAPAMCSPAREYDVRGLVLKVDPAAKTLLVSEDAIPGFMDAMTMPYQVSDAAALRGLKPGCIVSFRLTVTGESSQVSNIKLVKFESLQREPLVANSLTAMQEALSDGPPPVKVGEHVPNFTLIDQTRHRISLSDFSGKIVAITFAYTRCPLPDYCFRLSNNFGRLQTRFHDRLGSDLVLLTITFDPEHDTPEVLAKYGETWHADPKGWHLLTGAPGQVRQICNRLGSNFWPDEGSVTHSLHTLVVNRQGALVANIEGNRFSADQLGDLVQTYF